MDKLFIVFSLKMTHLDKCRKNSFLFLSFLLLANFSFSQPVIQNGNNIPQIGYSAPVSVGTATNGPGSPGANQTWDFSSITLTSVGTMTWVDPTATPYYSSYSSANYCFTFTIPSNPTQYNYLINSSTSLQSLASGITSGPGSGQDYSPDPLKILEYPFSYGSSYFDTWQTVGNSPDSVTVTYDAYGTLKMPYGTYSNVVRTQLAYNNGSDYTWYSINPLTPLLIYNYDSNLFTAIGETVSAVNNQHSNVVKKITLEQNYPNPFNPSTKIKYSIPKSEFVTLKVYDLLGREVATLVNKQKNPGSYEMNFDASKLASGIYLYRLQAGQKILTRKLLLIK